MCAVVCIFWTCVGDLDLEADDLDLDLRSEDVDLHVEDLIRSLIRA